MTNNGRTIQRDPFIYERRYSRDSVPTMTRQRRVSVAWAEFRTDEFGFVIK